LLVEVFAGAFYEWQKVAGGKQPYGPSGNRGLFRRDRRQHLVNRGHQAFGSIFSCRPQHCSMSAYAACSK
jgi:hypothetical protein